LKIAQHVKQSSRKRRKLILGEVAETVHTYQDIKINSQAERADTRTEMVARTVMTCDSRVD